MGASAAPCCVTTAHQAHPRHPPGRASQRGADPRYRRRRARRRHPLRPGRGTDAVHPVDLAVRGRRRQRRRPPRSQQPLRRRLRRGPVPVRRRRRPPQRRRPRPGRAPLQQRRPVRARRAEPGRHVRDGCGRAPAGDRASADGADSPAAAVTRATAYADGPIGPSARAIGAEHPGPSAGATEAGPAGGANPAPAPPSRPAPSPAPADHHPEHHGAADDDRSPASADHVAAGDPTPADHVVDHHPADDRKARAPSTTTSTTTTTVPADPPPGAAGDTRGTARGCRLGARDA